MVTTLLLRSLAVLSRNSWILVWVALEINTLSFCILVTIDTNQRKNITEASIKYFIIQSTASAVIIIYLAAPWQIRGTKLLFIAGTAAILTKLASAPFHRWFLEIVPKVEIKTGIILITWQKLAPIYILMFMIKTAVFVSLLARSILGRVIQIIKNKLLEILALSSIFNLRWIILARIIGTQRLFVFTLTYWSILLLVIIILTKIKITNRSVNNAKSINLWTTTLAIARLAGLPPTIGFYAKVQVVAQALKSSIKEVITVLLVIRATNFYIYLRIVSPRVVYSPTKLQKNKEKTKNISTLMILMNLLPLVTLTI